MNATDLDKIVRDTLREVAPDLDIDTVDVDADFHDELGLDSMDTLNLAIALHESTGVDIPEIDYPQINTIGACTAYLRGHGA